MKMRMLSMAVICFFMASTSRKVCSSAASTTSSVVELSASTLTDYVKSHKFVLVEFYAPWCGHCKALEPEYQGASTTMASEHPTADVKFAKVDATVATVLTKRYHIKGYPTLIWFVEGEQVTSNTEIPRKKTSLIKWVLKMSGPPAKILFTVDEVHDFISLSSSAIKKSPALDRVVVVGYFSEDSAESTTFKRAVTAINDVDILFGQVMEGAIAEAIGIKHPAVVMYKDNQQTAVYEGFHVSPNKSDDLRSWIAVEQLPLLIRFSDDSQSQIFGSGIDRQFLLFADDSNSKLLQEAELTAQDHRGQIIFMLIPKTESRVLHFFDVTAADYPTARLIHTAENKKLMKYSFQEGIELSGATINEFIASIDAGTRQPDYRSEEAPESNDDGVVVVVGKTFDRIVLDPAKDVIVKLYAPWCGHCKRLAPVWDSLAEAFAQDPDVVVAKMDASVNEHESISFLDAFPTIAFWGASKDPGGVLTEAIQYTGSRTIGDLVEFVKSGGQRIFEAHLEL